ncbi:MAG: GGDEF domain-containing protein [Pirellulaceae bacterium]
MVSLVFVVGMLNLVVGFAVAIALERRFVVYLPAWRRDADASAEVTPAADPPVPRDPGRDLVLGLVPDAWAALLENADAEFHTFMEASVQVLRLEVGTYREDLLDIEDLVRSAIAKSNPDAIRDAVQELVALNDEWVIRQADAVRIMNEKREDLGAYTELGTHLEKLLVQQAPSIENHCQIISACDPKHDEDAGAKIVQELGQLVQLAHELRDGIQQAMLAIVVREDRLETSDRKHHVDPATNLRNHLGATRQFHKWWQEDNRRQRLLSVALVDVDRFGKTNEFASTRVADHVFQALAGLLKQLVSRDSGFERVFRLNGHQFLLFFGDASREAAVGNVERIRQAVETTRFEHKDKQYLLTVRAGVTAVRPEEGTDELLARLEELVTAAKSAGGNRICTDGRKTLDIVPPHEPSHQQLRTIKIE